MTITVKDFMNFLKKIRQDKFLANAFSCLIASQNSENEIEHLNMAVNYLETAVEKKAREEEILIKWS